MTRCVDEWVLSVYVDGELAREQVRPLEAHLIECERCRARTLALREEAELLADALLQREVQPLAHRTRAAPARGLALGLVPAVAAVSVVVAVLSWLLDARAPASVGWLNPLRLTGASEMVFNLIFAIRDEAPELLALTVAVVAMLSVSGVLTFAVTLLLRRWTGPRSLALLALALLALPAPSQAHFGLHKHEDFHLAAGEVHEGTLLLSGANVDIDGTVIGDVIVGARRLAVRGTVHGNLYVLARTVELAGAVQGSVHVFSHVTLISGEVSSDIYAFTEQFTLDPDGRVGRNASVVAEETVLEGSVGRDFFAASDWTEVRGRVGRNLETWYGRLELRDTARVGGNVDAMVDAEDALQVAAGAVVGGEKRTHLDEPFREHRLERYTRPGFYLFLALGFVAALLVGMLAHTLAPSLFEERLETARDFFGALGLGFVAAVATPIALLVAAITLVGIPLALIGAGVYVIALYLSGIVVAALVGSTVLRGDASGSSGFFLVLLVGLSIVVVVAHLPFVAVPVHVVVALTGLGLLVRRARAAWGARQRPA